MFGQTRQQNVSPKSAADLVAAAVAAAVESVCMVMAYVQVLADTSAAAGARCSKQHPLAVLPALDPGCGGGAGQEEQQSSGRPSPPALAASAAMLAASVTSSIWLSRLNEDGLHPGVFQKKPI